MQRSTVLTAFQRAAALFLAASMVPAAWAQDAPQVPSAPSAQMPAQQAVPSKSQPFDVKEYSKPRSAFPNLLAPYTARHVAPPNVANTPRIDQFLDVRLRHFGSVERPKAAGSTPFTVWLTEANAALCALAAYLAWVSRKRRIFSYEGSSLTLPSGSMTLLQLAIGLADLSCCSLVMYMLMPQVPAIDFTSLAVVVVIGTLIGFASHAPGAIGALDVAMLVGLPGFDRTELVATLLLYRLLYFVAPFALALAGLAAREAYVHFVSKA